MSRIKADTHPAGIASEHFVAGNDDKTGGIVIIIMDVLCQNIQSIQPGGIFAADSCLGGITVITDLFAGCRCIGIFLLYPFLMLIQIRFALR